MKKLILFTALFTVIYSHAQNKLAPVPRKDSRNRIHLGFKLGLNHSNIFDAQNGVVAANPKYGFAAGAFLNIPVGKFLGIHPEVMYSQKGFKGSGLMQGNSYSINRTSSYVDVPVLVALKPLKILTIVAGPQYSYLVNQSDIIKSNGSASFQEQNFNNDNIRKNTLCGVVGADLNLLRLVFSARYGWDMLQNYGNGTSSMPRYKNVWVQGTVGFRLL